MLLPRLLRAYGERARYVPVTKLLALAEIVLGISLLITFWFPLMDPYSCLRRRWLILWWCVGMFCYLHGVMVYYAVN